MLKRFWKFTVEKFDVFCLGISSTGLALVGFLEDIKNTPLEWLKSITGITCIVLVMLAAIGIYFATKKEIKFDQLKVNIKNLEQENESLERITNERLNPRFVVEVITKTTYELLDFSHTERISVFRYDSSKDRFNLVARHSKNINFTRKVREFYEVDQGCLGHAWANGEHISIVFPDYTNEPDIYADIAKHTYKINKSITKGFSMKSRLYYGFQLESPNRHNPPVGVAILETLNKSFPDAQSIDTIKLKLRDSRINELLAWSVESIPNKSFEEAQEYYG